MKFGTRLLILFVVIASAVFSDGRHLNAKSAPDARRLRFRITTVEESAGGGGRRVLSDAAVEGPPGTDFNIGLEASRFKMDATFLTDLTAPDSLKVRAKLITRRLYGYSEQNLPLYEEDDQGQTLQLGFDEMVVLLPFGRNGGDNRLKIEITPAMSDEGALSPSGEPRPLKIDFLKKSAEGEINIQAWKIPHRFAVEATLLEDGREVARRSADMLLEEPQDLTLEPTEQSSAGVVNNPLVVSLSLNQFMKNRPTDEIAIGFDLFRLDKEQGGKRLPLGLRAAGVSDLSSSLSYDVSGYYLNSSGRKYELRFKIRLAAGERAE